MNKLITVLLSILLVLGVTNGFFVYQLHTLQNQARIQNQELQEQITQLQQQNSELQDQLSGVQDQISELQNQNSELRDDTSELRSQITELQNQNSNLQDEVNELKTKLSNYTDWVEITNVTIEPGNPICGLTYISYVNVTVENFGLNNVEGLKLSIQHTSLKDLPVPEIFTLDVLRPGEKRKIQGYFEWILGQKGEVIFTLKADNITLNEHIIPNWS